MSIKHISRSLIILICLLGASFYFYETILETVPAAMINGIMRSFHINAAKAGIFDTCYFVTYAIMQIPGGALLDKFGARKIMPLAAISCFIGLSLFGLTHDYYLGLLGRFIAGLGGTFGLMGAMFIVSSWVPKNRLAVALGLTITIGLSGGLLQGPLVNFVHQTSWRHVTLFLALVALLLALIMIIILRDNPLRKTEKIIIKDIIHVIRSKQNWWIGLFGGLLYIPTGTLASLWGANYFHAYFPHITLSTAASMNSMIFLGWIVGSPVAGILSDSIQRRKLLLGCSGFLCAIILMIMGQMQNITVPMMFFLSFLVGLSSSFSGLTFVMGVERNPASSGTAIGFINMLAIIPTIIVSPIFGWILDHNWQGHHHHGARIFMLSTYQQAMKLEYGLIFIAFLIAMFLIKESYSKKT
jgi:MFS family permease